MTNNRCHGINQKGGKAIQLMQTATQTLNLWLYFPDFFLPTISCIDALTYLQQDNHGFFLQLHHGVMTLDDFPL